MVWTPSQDPWGIGMLASAAVFGIALVLVNARRMAVRPRTGVLVLTGAAVVAFLVCAAMGTLERVRIGPAETAAATEGPPTGAATPHPLKDPLKALEAGEESDAMPAADDP